MAVQGTLPTLPIPCDDIPHTTIIAFTYFLYYLNVFTTTRDSWQAIRSLALKWCFTQIMVKSLYELKHFDQQCFTPYQRQLLSTNSAYFVNTLQLRHGKD